MGAIKSKNLRGATLTAYVEWLRTPSRHHTVGVGNGPDRPPRDRLFIHPFNVRMPTNMVAKASASSTAYSAIESKVAGYVQTILEPTSSARGLREYSPARVVFKTGVATKGGARTSHITNREYLNYGGNSVTVPFGKSGAEANETEAFVFRTIRQRFANNFGAIPAGQQVTLIKEKFTERT